MTIESISASKTQQSQPVREVFPYIKFCVVPQLASKKWGYWQLQQGYSTPVLLAKEIPWIAVSLYQTQHGLITDIFNEKGVGHFFSNVCPTGLLRSL